MLLLALVVSATACSSPESAGGVVTGETSQGGASGALRPGGVGGTTTGGGGRGGATGTTSGGDASGGVGAVGIGGAGAVGIGGVSAAGGGSGPGSSTHVVAVSGNRWTLDGTTLDLWGVRVASGALNQAETDRLLANLDSYAAYGINALTVFYQGSSGGFINPFSADGGSINGALQTRMESIIRAADARSMVVIVGIFYTHADSGAFANEAAVRNAVKTVATKLQPFRNVIINLANEHTAFDTSNLPMDLTQVAKLETLAMDYHSVDAAGVVGAGGYDMTKNTAIGKSPYIDALLFDDNVGSDPTRYAFAHYDTYQSAGVRKPIVNVELWGAYTKNWSPRGVTPATDQTNQKREIDQKLARPGLSLFYHNSPWFQGSNLGGGAMNNYQVGGTGTADSPGVKYFFDYLRQKKGLPAVR